MQNKYYDEEVGIDYLESYKSLYRFLLRNDINKLDKLNRIEYNNHFLNTKYWEIISTVIKMNLRHCEICGIYFKNWRRFCIHHEDYNIRGYEIFNRKKLFCVCHSCHEALYTHRHDLCLIMYSSLRNACLKRKLINEVV